MPLHRFIWLDLWLVFILSSQSSRSLYYWFAVFQVQSLGATLPGWIKSERVNTFTSKTQTWWGFIQPPYHSASAQHINWEVPDAAAISIFATAGVFTNGSLLPAKEKVMSSGEWKGTEEKCTGLGTALPSLMATHWVISLCAMQPLQHHTEVLVSRAFFPPPLYFMYTWPTSWEQLGAGAVTLSSGSMTFTHHPSAQELRSISWR